MLQYRRNDPSRRRRIKRDVASAPKKGVAGLRTEPAAAAAAVPAVEDSEDNAQDAAAVVPGDQDSVADALGSLNIHDEDDEN